MKSIFKKIAFVLALAMVVTAFPAKTAAAAASGPQLKAHRVLYLNEGGDVTGTYLNKAYATVWNFKEDGYTVRFEPEDEDIVTVGAKKGMITAVSVGTTRVKATFSKDGAEDVVKYCKVEVKKNAAVVTIDEASEKAIGELKVGEQVTAVAVKTDAEGSNEDITDGVRFRIEDDKIATVNAKTGEITAVATGETKLFVYGVQWEYSMTEKKYKLEQTTPETEYPLVVTKGTITDAKQISLDQIELTATDEETAKNMKLEDVKVEYFLAGTAITDFIKSVAANGTQVIVTLHNPIVADQQYRVTYGDASFEFKGAKADVAAIQIATTVAEAGQEVFVAVTTYNADGVRLTTTTESSFATSNISLSADESLTGDYYLDTVTGKIYFFNANKSAIVKATYEMGFDDYGNKIPNIEVTGQITSYSPASAADGNVEGWAAGAEDADTSKLAYSTAAIRVAVGDYRYFLFGKYTRKTAGQADETLYTNGTEFTYSSTNENVLLVNANQLLPVSQGAASVIVKKGDQVVGVANVIVDAARTLDRIEVSVDNNKLSAGVKNSVITVKAFDQMGQPIDIAGEVTITQTNTGNKEKAKLGGLESFDGTSATITSSAIEASPVAAYLRVVVNHNGVEKAQNVILSVKKADSAVASYKVATTKGSIDEKVEGSFDAANYTSVVTVESYDKDGFKIEDVAATTATTAPTGASAAGKYIVITKGNDNISGFVSLTGSAITAVTKGDNGVVAKAPTGSYLVRVYNVANNRAQVMGTASIVVSDSTAPLVVTQETKTVASLDAAGVNGAVSIKRNGSVVAN
ncbi:MAG: hypothetical protein K2N94_01145, partial [Lachnospiraceae bacterium]|nr:hypothetical protein [Lachnospiraceae bacterium]